MLATNPDPLLPSYARKKHNHHYSIDKEMRLKKLNNLTKDIPYK